MSNLNRLITSRSIELPCGELVIYDKGHPIGDASISDDHIRQGFVRSAHSATVYSSFHIAQAKISVIKGAPREVKGDRAVAFPLHVSSGCIELSDGFSDHDDCIEVKFPKGEYWIVVCQTIAPDSTEDEPKLDIEVYVSSGAGKHTAVTLIADGTMLAGDEKGQLGNDLGLA